MTTSRHKTVKLDNQLPEEPFSGEPIHLHWTPSIAPEETPLTLIQVSPNHPSLHSSFRPKKPTTESPRYPSALDYPSHHRINLLVDDTTTHDSKFQDLAQSWKHGTWHMSSIKDMIEHPAYRAIIKMGEPAVPLLLKELQTDIDHWFIALSEITGANPVPREDAGVVEKMRESWLSWGRKNSYI